MRKPESRKVWTVAEAKARLSEVLRLAEEEGPQRIGARKCFVVVPEHLWQEKMAPINLWANGWWRMCHEA